MTQLGSVWELCVFGGLQTQGHPWPLVRLPCRKTPLPGGRWLRAEREPRVGMRRADCPPAGETGWVLRRAGLPLGGPWGQKQ